MKFKYKLFKSFNKAVEYAAGIANAAVYINLPHSKTKDLYMLELYRDEGEIDINIANEFPYMVSWIE